MIKLKIKNPQVFIEFLKRFASMDKQILVEIENKELKCKFSTIEKSVIKYSKIKLEDAFSWEEGSLPEQKIKIGIFNIDKIINSFKQYSWNDDTFLNIKFLVINEENVAQEITIESKSLDMTFPCTSLSMFKFQLEDELVLNKIMNTENNLLNFAIEKDNQNKVLSLCSLDSDNEIISFISDDKGIRIKGKSFNLKVSDVPNAKNVSKISKNLYAMLDKENYNSFILNNKIVFISTESNTMTCIANVSE